MGTPQTAFRDPAWIDQKRSARMAMVDTYPPEVRELIHDYGLPVVKSIWDIGVRRPKHIRHIVETVLNEFSPTRGSYSAQGPRLHTEETR